MDEHPDGDSFVHSYSGIPSWTEWTPTNCCLIAAAREEEVAHEYLLGWLPRINISYSLPDPLKELRDRIFTQPEALGGPGASDGARSRDCIGYDQHERGNSPTR